MDKIGSLFFYLIQQYLITRRPLRTTAPRNTRSSRLNVPLLCKALFARDCITLFSNTQKCRRFSEFMMAHRWFRLFFSVSFLN